MKVIKVERGILRQKNGRNTTIKKLDKSKIKVRPATSGGTGMTLKASIVVTKSEEKEQQMMRKK